MEETAYLGPHLTIRDGKYLTKHVFVGGERVASKMDPDWFQEPPTLYFHTDHLGSTNYVTSDRQALVQHDEYMLSGEVWQNATDSRYELARRFLFTGKELDIHTGLYDFGARSYDARQGQWLSPDPAFDGLNLYGYVHNNPVNLIDPTGLSAETQTWTDHDYQDEGSTINGDAAALGGRIRGPGGRVDSSMPENTAANGTTACSGQCSDNLNEQTLMGRGAALYQRYEMVERQDVPIESTMSPVDLMGGGVARATVGAGRLLFNLAVNRATSTSGAAAPLLEEAVTSTVQANRIAGNAFRDEIAEALRNTGLTVETEVYKATVFGKRYIDIEVSEAGRVLGGIETKLGGSAYTARQRAKDAWLWLTQQYRVNVVRGP